MVRTKSRPRANVWWPDLDKQLEKLVRGCRPRPSQCLRSTLDCFVVILIAMTEYISYIDISHSFYHVIVYNVCYICNIFHIHISRHHPNLSYIILICT